MTKQKKTMSDYGIKGVQCQKTEVTNACSICPWFKDCLKAIRNESNEVIQGKNK
jgi:hypothetical protein